MADEPRPTNLPITATDLEHRFWTDQLEPSGKPRTSELLEEVPSFSYKDRVVSVSRKDLEALDNFLGLYIEDKGPSSVPPRIRNEWTVSGKKWHQDLWDRSESIDPNYPLVPAEEEHKPGLPRFTGIGQVFRGLGSMLGGKKMQAVRKLIALAQQGYELLPEDRQLLGEVLDMEALTKQIPGTGKGVDYFRQLLGMGPEEGGITSLPMDEASRAARAEKQGFNIDSYHATRGDFTTFEKGDLGYHFGSTEQANTRLWMRRSRGENPDMMWTDEEIAAANRGEPLPQENIMPVKLRLHNPLELPDVGHWQRPEVIIRRTLETEWGESRADELQDLEDKSDKLREPYGFMDDWAASPEASEIMDELRDLMKKDGYDGIKYRNIVEIEYDEEDAPTAGADPYSYIVFDAENIRSRFAEFDPAQSESPDITKAAGGFIDKPLYERTL